MNANSLEERTFTVYDGKILQLPTLTMSDLRIASSPQGEAFVKEHLHMEGMIGFPLIDLYRDHGVILQPLNTTTSHVLLVLNDEKALEMMAMKRPMKGVTKSSSSLECLNTMMKHYTIGQEVTFNVANGKTITLPELNEEQIELVQKEVHIEYMRNAIHHPNWVGWPDATKSYKDVGFVLQALNHNTARVLLVIDDAPVVELLAAQYAAYQHWGYTLHIDEATVLRPHLPPPKYDEDETAAKPPQQSAPKTDLLGMEVA